MNKIIDFLRWNYVAFIFGVFFFALYLYYDNSGNSICDCETTEAYNPSQSQYNRGVYHYYHK